MNIQQLLQITVERNASDLHLVVGYPPMIRIYGELIPVIGFPALSEEDLPAMVLPMLSPLQKTVLENSLELDFSFTFQNRARFRANVFHEMGRLAVAFRLIPMAIPRLENLGLPNVASRLATLRQGLVLVVGPTGHGKSTTLAALINHINQNRPAHILTVEDPIEYTYPKGRSLVSQRQMLTDTKDWPNALRAALREDPDVVLVGEMRDYETIAATVTIAETGHLVFATLHTNSAAQTIDRVIDIFPERQQSQIRSQLASTLEAVISQRLVPTIKPGRILAVEILLRTPALAALVRESKTHLIDNLIQTSAELGMVSLESSLAVLVRDNQINIDVAQNYSLRPDLLVKLVGSGV